MHPEVTEQSHGIRFKGFREKGVKLYLADLGDLADLTAEIIL